MARGFESKSVADQQESAEDARERPEGPSPAVSVKRHGLELARANLEAQLKSARAENHREIVRRALAAVYAELAALER